MTTTNEGQMTLLDDEFDPPKVNSNTYYLVEAPDEFPNLFVAILNSSQIRYWRVNSSNHLDAVNQLNDVVDNGY